MKKVLILVMSHNGDTSFDSYKKIWEKKSEEMKNKFPMDVLFLYSDNTVVSDYEINGNKLISKCEENYWQALLTKLMNGLDYFLKNDYDLVFKTNLSTFVNPTPFYEHVTKNCNNREYVYDGIVGSYEDFNFVSGAGILLNRKSCELIVNHKNLINDKWTDDIFLGYVLNKLNKVTPNTGNLKRFDLIKPEESFDFETVKDYPHIRVKVRKGSWDGFYFDKLFNLIYPKT